MTSFVGRGRELLDARGVLSNTRLLTLVGVGGVGKTRLAVRLGDELSRVFPGGIWLVDLSAVSAETEIAAAVSRAVAGPDGEALTTVPALATLLDEKSTLLILDNCEHLLDNCARFSSAILGATNDLRILATSRQPLGVLGEHILEIGPLATPAQRSDNRVGRYEAVQLFTERASSAVPSFALSRNTATAVAEVCRRLDGIPLAIELAAIRLRILSLPELLTRLDDQHQLLGLSSRAAQPRQRSLHALNNWSYELCSEQERLLWARLSTFADRFDLAAATAVCSDDGIEPAAVADLLAALVEKSVITRAADDTEVRGLLMESTRQFGDLHLTGRERAKLRKRHAHHFAQVAVRLTDDLHAGGCAKIAGTVQQDHGNLTNALEYLHARDELPDETLNLATLLCLCPGDPQSFSAARARLGEVARMRAEPSPAKARALWAHAAFALAGGDQVESKAALREAALVADQIGDKPTQAYLTELAGLAAATADDLDTAGDLLARAFRAHATRADRFGILQSYRHQLVVAWLRSEPDRVADAQALPREFGLTLLPEWAPYASFSSGLEHLRGFASARAAEEFSTALAGLRRSGDDRWIALCFEALAQCAWLQNDHGRAARLLGFAGMVWQALEVSDLFVGGRLDPHGECAAHLRSRMGDKQFLVAAEAGADMSLEEAVELVLNGQADGREQPADGATAVLTQREFDVAALVSQGLTNQAIGAELSISNRTVESHIEHIMTKLGATRRTQIASWFTTVRREP